MTNLKMVSTVKMVIVLVAFLVSGLAYAQPNTNDAAILILKTTEVGMHRISYEDLANLEGLKHSRFALLSDGEPVPVFTQGDSDRPNRFGPGGYIAFYAEDSNNLYSAERAFTLVYDRSKRVNIGSEVANPSDTAAFVNEYTHTQEVEEDRYYDFVSPSKSDPWHYGQLFSFNAGAKTTADFTVDNLVGTKADLSVNVYGIVDVKSDINDHHFVASMNGTEVGDQQFDGNVQSTLDVAQIDLNNGANQFDMSLRSIAGNPFDAIGLNKITLTYQRSAIATDKHKQLEGRFVGPQAKVVGVGATADVYRKVSNTFTKLRRTETQNGELDFKINGGNGEFVVVNDYYLPTVAAIPESVDISSGNAEYLIITHESFKGAELDSLVQMRSADYSVKVVDIEQVYAQYGHHVPSAEALHDYIKYAAANLDTRFVTFIGSDTYDYKNIKSNSVSFIPTMYAETPGGLLFIRQTPSDASYGDLDADGVPDIPIGRLSVRTQGELATVMEKIRDYQAREGYAGRILIASDKDDIGNGISFADDVDAMIAAIPNEWQGSIRADYKAIPDVDGDQQARDKILNAINAGVSVTAYIGHSSQQLWSRANPALFKTSDIAGLTNIDKPTLVTQWGCWNTYFVDPSGNSMADRFLVGGDNGAVTVLGASTLTTSEGERTLGIELNKRMYIKGKTIGEAVIEAKQALAITDPDASDILLGWQIIGDPALVINP